MEPDMPIISRAGRIQYWNPRPYSIHINTSLVTPLAPREGNSHLADRDDHTAIRHAFSHPFARIRKPIYNLPDARRTGTFAAVDGVSADHGMSHHMPKGLAIRRPLDRRTIFCTLLVCAAATVATNLWAVAAATKNADRLASDSNKKDAAQPAEPAADLADARLISVSLPLSRNADTST